MSNPEKSPTPPGLADTVPPNDWSDVPSIDQPLSPDVHAFLEEAPTGDESAPPTDRLSDTTPPPDDPDEPATEGLGGFSFEPEKPTPEETSFWKKLLGN